MVMIICPDVSTTPEDFNLSSAMRQIMVSLIERPKTVNEIETDEKMNLSTVFKSINKLAEQEMVFGKKPEFSALERGKTINRQSDVTYWELTDKGYLWAYNLGQAYNMSDAELKPIKERVRQFCRTK